MTDQAFRDRFHYDPDKDLIGSGGFGSVYRAYDYTEKRYVALKISQVKDIYGKFTLLNEVELSKKIDDHTNVARYELGFRFKVPFPVDYAIMAYYEEGNLDMVLRKRFGHLTDKEYYEIVEGLLEGIGHLHNENIIHRDLKLANILMLRTKQGQWRPKIADFGLSRQIEDSDASIANSAIGITIAYAAPEQIEGNPIRKNVDLWALGVIVYRLLTGDMPFAATQNADPTNANLEMSRKITQVELPEKLNTIPEPYQTIIKRCFVKDTKDRPQSAYELLDILKRFKPDSNSWKDTTTQSSLGKPFFQSSPSFDEPIAGTEISPPSVPKPTIAPKMEEIVEESTQLEMPSSSNAFVAAAANEGETLIEPHSTPKTTPKTTSKSAAKSTTRNTISETKTKNTVDDNKTLIEPQSVPKIIVDENKTLIEPQPAPTNVGTDRKALSGKTKKLIGAGLLAAILSFGICKMIKPADTTATTTSVSAETATTESATTATATTAIPNNSTTPNTIEKPKIDPKTGRAIPVSQSGQAVPTASTTSTPTASTASPTVTPTTTVIPVTTPTATTVTTSSAPVVTKPTVPTATTPPAPAVVKPPLPTPPPPTTVATPTEPSKPAPPPALLMQNTGILKLTKCPTRNCCGDLVGRTVIIKNFFVEPDGSISINSSSSVAVSTPSTAIKNIICQKAVLEAFMSNYKFSPPKNGRYEYKNFSFTN